MNGHYTHPDIAVPRRRILERIVIACLAWTAIFLWTIWGD